MNKTKRIYKSLKVFLFHLVAAPIISSLIMGALISVSVQMGYGNSIDIKVILLPYILGLLYALSYGTALGILTYIRENIHF